MVASDLQERDFDLGSAVYPVMHAIVPSREPFKMNSGRTLTYLSAPAEVSMADRWFEVASVDHFWVRRRFEVFQQLAGSLIGGAREIAEIGCGNGLLQRQIEDAYGREVAGFDLNEFALKQSLTRHSSIFCYDVR